MKEESDTALEAKLLSLAQSCGNGVILPSPR